MGKTSFKKTIWVIERWKSKKTRPTLVISTFKTDVTKVGSEKLQLKNWGMPQSTCPKYFQSGIPSLKVGLLGITWLYLL